MKFQAKTEKEIQEEKLLPEGIYPFEISQGEDKISKAGNEMIQLLVRVYKPDGNFILVTDYLMEALAHKLRHAADVCSLLSKYETGVLVGADFVGKTGTLKLKIQPAKDSFPSKNVISDYVVPKDGEAPVVIPSKPDIFDGGDSIPF